MMAPLATKHRPETFDDLIGQEHLTSSGKPIRQMIENKKPLSFLLWGPPGCGKTTLARLFAKHFEMPFISLSGAIDTTASIKALIKEEKSSPLFFQKPLVFVDEIHRFSRLQQDAFLPLIEEGKIVLIAATTENPSFSLNGALLSRLRLFTLKPLSKEALLKILRKAIEKENVASLSKEEEEEILHIAQGDGRALLNALEEKIAFGSLSDPHRKIVYDREGDAHFDLISALHKSIRASDPDASLYWLARMIQAGEDPAFLFRRLIRAASEDVGLADPEALSVVLACEKAYRRLGSPEGDLAIAEAVVYLALAPKSASIYKAFNAAKKLACDWGFLKPPKSFLNAPTRLMKEEGYGVGYHYDHDCPSGIAGQSGLPQEIEETRLFSPTHRGFESELSKRLLYIFSLRNKKT